MAPRTPFPAPSNRRLTPQEEAKLEALRLTDGQWEWCLQKYDQLTPYPNVTDFCGFVERVEVPDDLVCRAELLDNVTIDDLVEELGELESAWCPTPETEHRIAEIRSTLEAAL